MFDPSTSSNASQIPSESVSEGVEDESSGSVLHASSVVSFQPSSSSSVSTMSAMLSPSVSARTEMFSDASLVCPPVALAQIVYSVVFITSVGVPQIVPFVLPKNNPSGSDGDISHVSGAEPDVCPANDCISVPFTKSRPF